MPKKKSSKATKAASAEAAAEGSAAVEQQKNDKDSEKPKKKTSNEIDEIFAGKKRKKPDKLNKDNAKQDVEAGQQISLKKSKKKHKDVLDKEGKFTDPPSRLRKKTEDGFTIYSEEELGINSSNTGEHFVFPESN